jgi:hypothetical protein
MPEQIVRNAASLFTPTAIADANCAVEFIPQSAGAAVQFIKMQIESHPHQLQQRHCALSVA